VYYSHEWDDMPFGLLGQAGFFSHFGINFNYREKEILLEYPDLNILLKMFWNC